MKNICFAAVWAALLSGSFAWGAADKTTVAFDGRAVLPTLGTAAGVWLYAEPERPDGSEALLLGHPACGPDKTPDYRFLADLAPGETVTLRIPLSALANSSGGGELSCRVTPIQGERGALSIRATSGQTENAAAEPVEGTLSLRIPENGIQIEIKSTGDKRAVIRLDRFTLRGGDRSEPVLLDPVRRPQPGASTENLPDLTGKTADEAAKIVTSQSEAVVCYPDLTEPLQNELIEWDWRMQDGVGTPNEPRTFAEAIEKRLPEVKTLLDDLTENADEESEKIFADFAARLSALAKRFDALKADPNAASGEAAETLWRDLHLLRRSIALANPLFSNDKILFAKHVPSVMSHQLTQVYGYCARSGGGLFLLEEPGRSMKTRKIETGLPDGNYMHPAVSNDGKTILFAFCEVPKLPTLWRDPAAMERHYQIYKVNADGSGLTRLTDGPFDHFSPTFLPDGDIIFISTRRGGFHRCGGGPCFVYTLTKMKADGSDIRPISYHETQEWNPEVTNDGRIVYTRWDYVDRDAVYYQNLWSTRQDGTDVRIFYGNNTFSPCGIWESKSVPGSGKIMAIGGPHHGMSAGSVMLLDNTLGVDGPAPVTRLTPEVLYPEAETPLPLIPQLPTVLDFDSEPINYWNANRADRPAERIAATEGNSRWPVHCFKSPWPFSEKYFLASYSFDKLLGEAGPNIPNQFGLYLCDAFGTRELLYRDPNISSVWASPLAERPNKPAYVSTLPEREVDADGKPLPARFFVQNVYESWPWKMPDVKIRSLRLVQVLPKTTPNANAPMVGAANASPGKQILGTVPVAEDGSAYFEAPSKTPFLLQALDENGRMVEGMRSLIYAQPGEMASCTGCHEDRNSSTAVSVASSSRQETPSAIRPGPDGSKPLSYPILVQPVLDRLCVECHRPEKLEGGVDLTGTSDGAYTKSYNALISRVNYTAWGLPDGNHEPMTTPYLFGTPASPLVKLLDAGHYDCKLSAEDWERLATWIDGANGLFYGTFNPENQKIQQTGGRIDGPDLE